MKVFATYNIKGGVGKTASAVNLAYQSSIQGYRTLLWDLDPQGAATFYFRLEPKLQGGAKKLARGKLDLDDLIRGTDFEGLDLLPADFSLRHFDIALGDVKKSSGQLARLLGPLEERYDHLFIDCAPSISAVSESVFVASDALLVPSIPTTLSRRTLEQLEEHLDKKSRRRVRVLPFFCMVDRRRSLHRQILEESHTWPFDPLEAEIPYSTWVEQMGAHRAPVAVFAHRSAPALAYAQLWQEIGERLAASD
ncbi:MAG: ParA family protein [Acidobacteriota bacterium]